MKAFTLVELLVVIAVFGALSGVILISINPVEKLAQSNDTKVVTDVGQISSGVMLYVAGRGYFPAATSDFAGAGLQMESMPVPPTGYGASYTYAATTTAGGACTTAAKNCTRATLAGQLKSAKYGGSSTTPVYRRWESYTAKTCVVATAGTACP